MNYINANQVDYNPRPQMGEIFVEGFYQWLKYFSKDKKKLMKAFEHIFQLDAFYLAVDGNQVAAITACPQGTKTVSFKGSELRKHLGFIRGTLANIMLKKHLENHPYPFDVKNGTGSIEFVATAPRYQGKGIAGKLINHIIEQKNYDEYILEVADTNSTAIKLYTRLGFEEFFRVADQAPKRSGINYLLYLKRKA